MDRLVKLCWPLILLLCPTRAIADVNPEAFEHFNQGVVAFRRGDIDHALAEFTEAIRLDPNFSDPYCNRANIYAVKKDFGRAIADYNQALRLAPADATIYYCRGAAYVGQAELQKALADFTEAIRLMPQFAIAYHNRGSVHMAKKDYRAAIADYQEVIRLAPHFPWGYFSLSHMLACCPKAQLRDGRKALEYAKKGCELAQWRNPGGLWALADAYAELGDFDKAIQWQEKALASAQGFPAIEQKKMRARLQLYKQGKPYRME